MCCTNVIDTCTVCAVLMSLIHAQYYTLAQQYTKPPSATCQHTQVLDEPNVDCSCHGVVAFLRTVALALVHAVQGARGLHAAMLPSTIDACIRLGPGPQLPRGVVHCMLMAVEGEHGLVPIPCVEVAYRAGQPWRSAPSSLSTVLGIDRETAPRGYAVLRCSLTVAHCFTVHIGGRRVTSPAQGVHIGAIGLQTNLSTPA